MIEIKRAMDLTINQLQEYSETARLDAEILLSFVLNKNRAYLYSHPETLLEKSQWKLFQQLVAKRSLGMPVAYLTGMREFWSLPLKVSQETLIPRPETELVVELSLQLMHEKKQAQILDLGTGSGAIAIALAKERSDWQISACDFSEGALILAKDNALRFNLQNIYFCLSDWFSNIDSKQQFDLIVSNPPYIAANDPHLQQGDLRFEPSMALVGGSDGLSALEHIIKHGIARLKPHGLLLIEHGFDQKSPVVTMLEKYGYVDVCSWQDIHGNDRVSGGRKITG